MRTGFIERLTGTPVRRVEDRRLLAGRGRYLDDVVVPDMAHAAFLRSPLPHARITAMETAAARALPGVFAVLTGEDICRITNPMVGMMALDGLYDAWHWPLAVDRVRLVGDPVALVVAESRAVAEDACELIEVDYEPLPAVANAEQALDGSRPAIWPAARDNVIYRTANVHGDVAGAFARADHVVRETFRVHRHSNQPMETRGLVAEMDPATGHLTVHGGHQAAHVLKYSLALCLAKRPIHRSIRAMAAQREQTRAIGAGIRTFLRDNPGLLKDIAPSLPVMARQAVRDPRRIGHLYRALFGLMGTPKADLPTVVTGDIGGAFGAKTTVVREEIAVAGAAVHLGRSVKWIEDRNEHLTTGAQAREEMIEVEAAVTGDGTVLGMRARLTMDMGAYPAFPYGAPLFARVIANLFPGPYRLPALGFQTRVTASNKGTYVAYRGPWATETWVRERFYDVIAGELGVGRDEIRLRNIIGPDELPRPMTTGLMLDVRMSAKATLERALDVADFANWEAEKARAAAEGRYRGLGFATYIEPAPGPPGYFNSIAPGFAAFVGAEPAATVLEADGSITIHTAQVPHGQGHETTLAQVAADQLGVAVDAIRVRYGDTRQAPFGLMGTGGSRSAAVAGGAVTIAARDLRDRIVDLAAELLEAAPTDLVIEGGQIHVAGVPSVSCSFAEVAAEARRRHPAGIGDTRGDEAIRVIGHWDGGEGGWAQATHVCWVEVDVETGTVHIDRYVVVEDCGEIINPAIVDGQIRGGVAQGIGAVLYEKTAYADDGNHQAGTFMDYLIPTAMEIPDIEIHHVETPSDIPFNYRGAGEGGMIGAPAAVTNAIEDALSPFGARITEQHLPPARILELAGVIPLVSREG